MHKKVHMLEKVDVSGYSTKLLCGRPVDGSASVAENTGKKTSIITCRSCLQRLYPGYSFSYEKDKIEDKWLYSVSHYEAGVVAASVYYWPATVNFPAFVTDLQVHNDYMNQGWATFLIRQLQMVHKRTIMLKSQPFGGANNRLNAEQLQSFYIKLGFHPLAEKKMIWFPLKNKSEMVKISITKGEHFFDIHVVGSPELSAYGKTKDEAVGRLICSYPEFFNIVF